MTYKTFGEWTITNEPVIRLIEHNQTMLNMRLQYDRNMAEMQKTIDILEATIADMVCVQTAEEDDYTGRTFTSTDIYRKAREYSGTVNVHDSEYKEPKLSSLKAFLNVDKTSEKEYVAQEYDCENFSYETLVNVFNYFGNIPFGFTAIRNNNTGKGHMLNCCYIEDKWYWMEPQGDKFYENLGDHYTVRYINI